MEQLIFNFLEPLDASARLELQESSLCCSSFRFEKIITVHYLNITGLLKTNNFLPFILLVYCLFGNRVSLSKYYGTEFFFVL